MRSVIVPFHWRPARPALMCADASGAPNRSIQVQRFVGSPRSRALLRAANGTAFCMRQVPEGAEGFPRAKPLAKVPSFLLLVAGAIAIGFAPIFVRLAATGPIATAFWRMALAVPILWIISRHQNTLHKGTFRSPWTWVAGLAFASGSGGVAFRHPTHFGDECDITRQLCRAFGAASLMALPASCGSPEHNRVRGARLSRDSFTEPCFAPGWGRAALGRCPRIDHRDLLRRLLGCRCGGSGADQALQRWRWRAPFSAASR